MSQETFIYIALYTTQIYLYST